VCAPHEQIQPTTPLPGSPADSSRGRVAEGRGPRTVGAVAEHSVEVPSLEAGDARAQQAGPARHGRICKEAAGGARRVSVERGTLVSPMPQGAVLDRVQPPGTPRKPDSTSPRQ